MGTHDDNNPETFSTRADSPTSVPVETEIGQRKMTDERLLAVLEPGVADRRQTEGGGGNVPGVSTDYWVTVCKVCRTASCWHGEFMCQRAAGADVVDVRASVLRAEDREHPDNFSESKLLEVCGRVRRA